MPERPAPSFTPPPSTVEPTPRWMRVRAGDVEVANSRRALLLTWYGPGRLPTYCFPPEDVRADLFRPSATPSSEEFLVDHDVDTGDLVVPAAARLFRDPPADLAPLDGYWTFLWDSGLSWFEEALQVHVHARDPSKRSTWCPSVPASPAS